MNEMVKAQAVERDMQEHPMDDFPVRALDFEIETLTPQDALWSKSSPEFSMYINALGLHVPYFERYLIHTMNTVKRRIPRDSKLYRDLIALSAQEGHHARNFMAFNKFLAQKYPRLAKIAADEKQHFHTRSKTDSEKRLVGFTAGYETFTFLAGLIILHNYKAWMSDSHPIAKALWVWHQVEEVEHGAVAHDVYRTLYGKHEFYRKWMVIVAGTHIALATARAYTYMMWCEGWWRSPRRAVKGVWFLVSTLARMAWQTRPVFSRDYNPRQHPLATSDQNPIAIAWRRYDKQGGNVLAINHEEMTRILNL